MKFVQSIKIHDCVRCHNKGFPKLLAEYELKSSAQPRRLTFTVTLKNESQVFSEDKTELVTVFKIEKPIVSQQKFFPLHNGLIMGLNKQALNLNEDTIQHHICTNTAN